MSKLEKVYQFIMSLPDGVRIHMSPKPIGELLERTAQDFRPKPYGLWYDCNKEWAYWVQSEMPHWECNYLYLVNLNDAPILRLESKEALLSFTEEYRSRENAWHVDWKRVTSEYSGIEISPYQWELRMSMETSWYYTWDVASGCIWNPKAVTLDFAGRWDEDHGEMVLEEILEEIVT